MKFNSPLPVSVPKECEKATKILLSFVDSRNDGLDGLIPRQVLEQAHGFAIFTVVKAGFLFSARAGSGIVIARLPDGTWSAPSAIGSAGMGVGGQAGAEMTDFLIVLNTRGAVKSFMSAGSVTLGGNMSLAVGPIGRNGAADVALNTKGKVAAMYSYSKTKGLFGGISVEGSIIVERQDANAIAYEADVTSKQLLSGVVPTPPWAEGLVRALERCTGLPTGQKWIQEDRTGSDASGGYHFGGVGSSSPRGGIIDRTMDRTKRISGTFSPSWGKKKNATSYFPDTQDDFNEAPSAVRSPFASPPDSRRSMSYGANANNRLNGFDTHFESDFDPNAQRPDPNRRSTDGPRKSGEITDYETRMRQNASPYSAFGGPSPTQTQFADISAQQRLALSRNGSWKSSAGSFFKGKDKDREAENGRPSSTFGVGWASKFTSGRDNGQNDRKNKQFDLMTGDSDNEERDPFSSTSRGYGEARQSFDSGNGNTDGNYSSNGKRGFYPGLVETNLSTANKDADVWEDDPFGAKPKRQPTPKISTKPGLAGPQTEGVARAIALFDFVAQESGDLSFKKGDVIIVLKKTNSIDDWWTGKVDGREGIFPANFTEVV
ncbi:SH3 domain-containing protein [Ceratobasidium sp. AG-Ba]|nr:SH3 domain-containing protein [Ceratobasidium sp. AG-Ba]QRW14595.1 SH3 domain-containing protein [Ceratobasidium sp. AG-Ba]